jgi:hypothetical protein
MSKACGYRLDEPTTSGHGLEPTASLLALKREITETLTFTTSHHDAASFFTDLRLVVAALSASWPGSSHLIESEYRDRVDVYVSGQTDYRRTGGGGTRRYQVVDALPRDSAASAALLSAARSLFDVEDLRESLAPSFAKDSRTEPDGNLGTHSYLDTRKPALIDSGPLLNH